MTNFPSDLWILPPLAVSDTSASVRGSGTCQVAAMKGLGSMMASGGGEQMVFMDRIGVVAALDEFDFKTL